jgi:hypothetical protein
MPNMIVVASILFATGQLQGIFNVTGSVMFAELVPVEIGDV